MTLEYLFEDGGVAGKVDPLFHSSGLAVLVVVESRTKYARRLGVLSIRVDISRIPNTYGEYSNVCGHFKMVAATVKAMLTRCCYVFWRVCTDFWLPSHCMSHSRPRIRNMASGLQVPLPGYKKRRLQGACDICKHKKSKIEFSSHNLTIDPLH
jgi:hypothetical protein